MLILDGKQLPLTPSTCEVFAGQLDLTVSWNDRDEESLSVGPVPIGDIAFPQDLSGKSVRSAWRKGESDRSVFFHIRELMCAREYEIEVGPYCAETNELSIRCRFVAESEDADCQDLMRPEDVKIMTGTIECQAECGLVEAETVIQHGPAVPIYFAQHYLPMLGLPPLAPHVTRDQIISVFGEPFAAGGGVHTYLTTTFTVPDWIHYRFPRFILRFVFEEGHATEMMIL